MVIDFIVQYKWIFLFYLLLAGFLFVRRKRIVTQGKVIMLYRTVFGIRFIEKFSERFREWVVLFGIIGIGVGFIGMIVISVMMVFGLVQLFISPASQPGVSLVLPGVEVPGLGVLPFWHWLASIFVIAVIHEFSHGIVAHAHHLKVKFTGLVVLGPIIGAFVEPDEEHLVKADDVVQHSVYAAGAFSNILLAILALVVLNFLFFPIHSAITDSTGFSFSSYTNESLPFAQAGVPVGSVITGIGNTSVTNFQEFADELSYYDPGDTISVQTSTGVFDVTFASHPDNSRKPFLGISGIVNEFTLDQRFNTALGRAADYVLEWFTGLKNNGRGFFFWLYVLSFGIGLFNLLPLPIVDGGRMAQTFLKRLCGNEKGLRVASKISMFFLLVLVLSFVIPYLL